MAEGVRPMASEHKRIVDRLEALERRHDEDKELRRVHCDQHKRLDESWNALEESVSLLDKVAARTTAVLEVSRRLSEIEARLASKPDDFGGVTSTGAPKTMTRWVIVADKDRVFSRWVGMVFRSPDAEPTFFDDAGSAHIVLRALFGTCSWVKVRLVEVIERDGRLIEARYA